MDADARHGQSIAPFKAAFAAVSAELDGLGHLTPESIFPTKPDSSKS